MGILYDNVRRANSSYVPQFVGSEANELKAVGDVLDQRYRENQAALDDALITAVNEKYAPGDEAIGYNIYNDLSDLRNRIASSDENFERSSSLVRTAVRDKLATNPDRIYALRNSAEYDKYLNEKANLGAEGVDFTPKFQGTVNPDGSYNIFKSKLERRLDYDKKKETFFNQFEADLKQSPFAQDANNPAFIKSVLTGGIADKRIQGYLNEAFNRYRQSGEYNQEFRKEQQDNPNLSSNQIDDVIKRSILSTGLERVHNIRKEDVQAIPKHALEKKENTQIPTTGTTPGHPVINTANTETLVDSFDTSREMNPQEKQAYLNKVQSPKAFGFHQYDINHFPKIEVKGKPETEPGSYIYNYNQLVNSVPEELKNQHINSAEAYKKAFEEAKKLNGSHTPTAIAIAPKQSGLYQDFLDRYAGSQIAVTSDDPTVKSLNEIIGEVSSNLNKGEKINIVPTVIAPQLPNEDWKGGALGFDIKVNGVSKKVGYVKLNDQVSEVANPINIVNQLSRNRGFDEGADGRGSSKSNPMVLYDYAQEEPETGKFIVPVVYTITVPTKDHKGKSKFKTTVYTATQELDKTGNKIGNPSNYIPMNIDQWNIKAWDQFVAPKLSNLLGSGQTVNTQDLKLFANDIED